MYVDGNLDRLELLGGVGGVVQVDGGIRALVIGSVETPAGVTGDVSVGGVLALGVVGGISGTLAANDYVEVAVVASGAGGQLTGKLDFGGDVEVLDLQMDFEFGGRLDIDGVAGEVVVWGVVDGTLAIQGGLSVVLSVVGLSTGVIDIAGPVAWTATIERPVAGWAGQMYLHSLAGSLNVDGMFAGGVLSGSVEIANDLTGEITIGSASYEADLTGSIPIHGDVFGGTIKVYGDMKPADPIDPNSPSPYIRIDGAFMPDDEEPSLIDIDGAYEGEKRFIAIDFDGYDAADAWEANATITIGPDPNPDEYTGNTPEVRIFATTYCKGDMLNDGLCDFGDIDALVAAFDPEAFGNAYPEFAGNRLYHGDLDCSGEVDFKDIDAFIARLGTCTPDCYEGDNMQGGGEGGQMQMMGGGAAVIAA